jgi:phosphoribosyl-ATP pyrophosphohydrolase/phosphoribosyl-AMP cyclohydrolase
VTTTEFLQTLEDVIQDRMANPVEGSYTANLVDAGTKRIAQKVGEEGVELALAAVSGDRQETIDEAADLFYHVIVLLSHCEIRLTDVTACLESRHGKRSP